MYKNASKRVYKSKHCVLFMTFRSSQRTLFMARRNWVLLALRNRSGLVVNYVIIHCLEVSCREDQITSAQRE